MEEQFLIKKSTLQDTADAIREKTGTTEPMTGADFPSKIRSIQTGGGSVEGVKLFTSINELENTAPKKENELAIVYANSTSLLTETTAFTDATLPKTVVLDTPVTDNDQIMISFKSTDPSQRLDVWGDLSKYGFNCDFMTGNPETDVRIMYRTEDGITYTREDREGEVSSIHFDTPIQFDLDRGMWDDRIGKFFIIGSYNFGGLFTSSNELDEKQAIFYTRYNPDKDHPGRFVGEFIYINNLLKKINALLNNTKKTATPFTIVTNDRENFYFILDDCSLEYETYNNAKGAFGIYLDNSKIGLESRFSIGWRLDNNATKENIDGLHIYKYNIFEDNELTPITLPLTLHNHGKFSERSRLVELQGLDVTAVCSLVSWERDRDPQIELQGPPSGSGDALSFYIKTNNSSDINTLNMEWELGYYESLPRMTRIKYIPAQTQFNTKDIDVIKGKFLGANGSDEGILGKMEDVSIDFIGYKTMIYNKYFCTPCKPINTVFNYLSYNRWMYGMKIALPIDTSNVTDMSSMFYQDRDLEFIPLYDTRKVITIESMFEECDNLKEIPALDLQSCKTMKYFCMSCNNLSKVDIINTYNVTNMQGAFSSCGSLKVVKLNVQSATNMDYTFAEAGLMEIDISESPILQECSLKDTFRSINSNCLIKVYNEASKQKVLSSRSDLTNVVIVNN